MRTANLLLFTLLFTSAANAADAPPKLPEVSEAMKPFIASNEISGAVTYVANKDGVLHLDAVGLADVAASKPMQPDSIFWIASMTKPVTAAALLMLQDEGKLSIDDPVAKYIPEFKDLKTASGTPANLTIKHLMTHTSGLAEVTPEVGRTAAKLADVIPSFLAKPVAFEPGSQWKYCQSGINTGGRIVEIVSGMSYPDFLSKRIFEPLGMKDTTFYLTDAQLPRLAVSYKRNGEKLEATAIGFLNGKSPTDTNRYPLANGGLFSTASDYGAFLRMVLNKGTLNGKTYLSPRAVEQMTTVQSGDVKTGFTPGNGWGIGWCVVREPQGVSGAISAGSHGHGGAYGTQAWIDPKTGLAHLLLIQRTNFSNAGGSDGSPVRQAFHESVAKSTNR